MREELEFQIQPVKAEGHTNFREETAEHEFLDNLLRELQQYVMS